MFLTGFFGDDFFGDVMVLFWVGLLLFYWRLDECQNVLKVEKAVASGHFQRDECAGANPAVNRCATHAKSALQVNRVNRQRNC